MFRLMFYSPRIAPNTGNAIRMVAATGCELHLVEPLGFDLSEPKLRRAGLDYHDLASVSVHRDLPAAWEALEPVQVYAFTAHASTPYADISYRPGDVLMFGPEPTGLDAATLADPHISAQVRIPIALKLSERPERSRGWGVLLHRFCMTSCVRDRGSRRRPCAFSSFQGANKS